MSTRSIVLDNVQVNGSLRIEGRGGLYSGFVRLPKGQTLQGNGTVTLMGLAGLESAGGTFTIGSAMTVRGGRNSIDEVGGYWGVGNVKRPTVNNGRPSLTNAPTARRSIATRRSLRQSQPPRSPRCGVATRINEVRSRRSR